MIHLHVKILADAMGLGKTVMTIALLLANPGKGGLTIQETEEKRIQTKRYPIKSRTAYNKGGGTLIICPMTLLGQWKVSIYIITSTAIFFSSPSDCGNLKGISKLPSISHADRDRNS